MPEKKKHLKDLDICVESIMTKKVETTTKSDLLYKAIDRMGKKGISCILITEKKRPVGVLTERDIIKRVVLTNLNPKECTVDEVMTSPVLSIHPKADIINAGNIMRKNNIRRLAIINDDKLVGLVTETDILSATTKYIKHLNWRLVEGEITLKEYQRILKDVKMLVEV